MGCEIDGVESNKIQVIDIAIAWFISRFFPVSHRDCFLYCFDMNVNRDSEVSVLYKKNGTIIREPVQSDSVVIPPTDVPEKDK